MNNTETPMNTSSAAPVQPNTPTITPPIYTTSSFAQSVRKSYPTGITSDGIPYAKLPDAELVKRVTDKYPVYQNQISDYANTVVPQVKGDEARGGANQNWSSLPGNILPSLGKTVGSIAQTVEHPIKTVEALGSDVAGGAGELGRAIGSGANVGKPETSDEQNFDSLKQFISDRYGSLANLKKTLINDPAGAAMDLATVLGGGAEAAGKIGLEGTAKTLNAAERVTNPIEDAIPMVGATGKALGKTGAYVAPKILGGTTGVGADVIKEAFRNTSPEFTQALRGTTDKTDLVDTAKQGLQALKDQRATAYQKQLAEVSKNNASLDISPVHDSLAKNLEKFNIKEGSDGALDFSRSTISDLSAQKDIEGMVSTVKDWGSQKGDRTPVGVDLLKRRLGDYYSPSGQARAFTTSLGQATKDILNKQVPGYTEMTKGYENASKFIKDVEQSLSLGGKAGTETTINKLAQGMKEDKEFRQSVIRQIGQITGKDITGPISGAALNTLLPRGLASRMFAGGAIAEGTAAVKPLLALFVAAPLFSPRIVGEFVHALGMTADGAKQFINVVKRARDQFPVSRTTTTETGFQTGRQENEQNQ